MNSTPIICQGDELESVLSGIRERGGFVASLETRVGNHNGNYRVNYSMSALSGEEPANGKLQVPNPAALNQFGGVTLAASHRTVCGTGYSPAATSFPHQCETPEIPAAPEAVKGEAAPRSPLYDPKSPVEGQPHTQCDGADEVGVVDSPGGVESSHLGRRDYLSIATRMAALQAKLTAAGKIRRSKTRESRLPHPND